MIGKSYCVLCSCCYCCCCYFSCTAHYLDCCKKVIVLRRRCIVLLLLIVFVVRCYLAVIGFSYLNYLATIVNARSRVRIATTVSLFCTISKLLLTHSFQFIPTHSCWTTDILFLSFFFSTYDRFSTSTPIGWFDHRSY